MLLSKKGYYTISPYDDGYVSFMFHLYLLILPATTFLYFFKYESYEAVHAVDIFVCVRACLYVWPHYKLTFISRSSLTL